MRKKRKDELWGIWAGDDVGYFVYWAFAPSAQTAKERLLILWPNYSWKKAYRDGCRCVRVSIKEVNK